ncbi:MAG TPA: hypothetical protein VG269_05475 [Tepidisphaeraceae bacterium]|jgi:sulfite reductase beta subunit-like hemoprotein|nr:hypothetical protein [Tepidisphaeraceae bacterium]
MSAKCPKCEKLISHVNLEKMGIHVNNQTQWNGVSYSCPLCQTLLSVSMDPIALNSDVVENVIAKAKKLLGR